MKKSGKRSWGIIFWSFAGNDAEQVAVSGMVREKRKRPSADAAAEGRFLLVKKNKGNKWANKRTCCRGMATGA